MKCTSTNINRLNARFYTLSSYLLGVAIAQPNRLHTQVFTKQQQILKMENPR